MSQFSETSVNPYQSSPEAPRLSSGKPKLPTFALVMVIVDLVFLGFRALLVLAGMAGLAAGLNDPMVLRTGYFEVATGLVMVLAGVPADIGLLMRQKWAVWLAWIKVAATVGSILVGLWQATFMMDRFPPGTPEFVGMIIGASITVLIRFALIGLYSRALLLCAKSFNDVPPVEKGW